MSNAVVKGIVCYGAAATVRVFVAEVVPKAKAYLWKKHAGAAASSVHPVLIGVSFGRGDILFS